MKHLLLILFVSIHFMSCEKESVTESIINIEFVEIAKGVLGGSGNEGITKQNLVIKTKADWESLVKKMDINSQNGNSVADNFNETDTDFSKHIVIAIFDKLRYHGGTYIGIEKIVENFKEIHITLQFEIQDATYVTTDINQPFYIAKIPRSNLPLVFKFE